MIHFHIKSSGLQGLVFVQLTFEEYTTHFYFEDGRFLHICLDICLDVCLDLSEHFYVASFLIKTCFL